MRTVGEILQEKRKQLNLSYDQIEKETKIRRKYLEAIEKSDYCLLPEGTSAKGFIRNYAMFLGLPAESALAVFRRDFSENEKGQIVPRGFTKEIEEKFFCWTPKITFILIVLFIISAFSIFFLTQYDRISSPPDLEIFSPSEGQVFKEKIKVSGKTEKDASVKIDGSLISISNDGSFVEEIVLPRGENILVIEAANRQGKKRTVNVKIKVE